MSTESKIFAGVFVIVVLICVLSVVVKNADQNTHDKTSYTLVIIQHHDNYKQTILLEIEYVIRHWVTGRNVRYILKGEDWTSAMSHVISIPNSIMFSLDTR